MFNAVPPDAIDYPHRFPVTALRRTGQYRHLLESNDCHALSPCTSTLLARFPGRLFLRPVLDSGPTHPAKPGNWCKTIPLLGINIQHRFTRQNEPEQAIVEFLNTLLRQWGSPDSFDANLEGNLYSLRADEYDMTASG